MGFSRLQQNFTTCKAGKYQLSWSMYLPKGAAQGIDPRTPGMTIWVYDPSGAAQVGTLSFGPNSFNSTIGYPVKLGKHKANEWVNFSTKLANNLKAGKCTLVVNWFVPGQEQGNPNGKLTLKLDNFAIKAV
jgi:hypothetical protein